MVLAVPTRMYQTVIVYEHLFHCYDHSFPLRYKAQKGYEIRACHAAFKILC